MKKLIALLLVLAMVFAFVGCDSEVKTETKTEKTAETTKTTDEVAEEVTEPEQEEAEQVSLSAALENTVKALEAGNLTVAIEGYAEYTEETTPGLVAGYYSPVSGQLQVMFDAEAKELTVYGKVMADSDIQTVLVYDGWSVSGGYYQDGWYKEDISEDLEMLFADTEEAGGLSELFGDMSEDEIAAIEEVIDLEKLVEILKTLATETFSDEQWVKDNLGYTVTTENGVTVHTFDLDIVALIKLVLGEVKDAFVDPKDYDDMMDMIEESLEEAFKDIEGMDFKIKLIQTGDMITGIALEVAGVVDGENGKAEITVTISEIGTTTIDTEMLAGILEELPDYEEYSKKYYDDYYGDSYGDFYSDNFEAYEGTETVTEEL